MPLSEIAELDQIQAALVQLNVGQHNALSALMEGKSFAAAADLAGVGRNTVSYWVRHNAAFRAAYNAWRKDLAESINAQLHSAAQAAATVVREAIENGDTKIAMTLLRHLGSGRFTPAGPDDYALTQEEIALLDNEEKHALKTRVNTTHRDRLFFQSETLRERQ
jgi:hypothetical protein